MAACKPTPAKSPGPGIYIPGATDTCGGYSWCTTAPSGAAAPVPRADAKANGPAPHDGPPVPAFPYHCATSTDPADTGLHIDPIDREIVATVFSSCALYLPERFTLTLEIFKFEQRFGTYLPVAGSHYASNSLPGIYPDYGTQYTYAPCSSADNNGKYFLQIQVSGVQGDGKPITLRTANGKEFDTAGNC